MGRSKSSASNKSESSSNVSSVKSSSSISDGKEISTEVKWSDLLTQLKGHVNNVQDTHSRCEQSLGSIAKVREKVVQDQKMTQHSKSRLKASYTSALQDAEKEYDAVQKALQHVRDMRKQKEKSVDKKGKQILRRGVLMGMLQQSGQMLPLWVGKPGEEAPPLCGAIQADPSYVIPTGSQVAARVKSEDSEENWILSEVISFNGVTNKFDVDDIDAEEGKERHTLSKRRVVPLPMYKADPELNPEALYPLNTLVMALYPQTTCFYRAIIHQQPKTHSDDYSVLFEDSSYHNGYSPPLKISQRFIIWCKDDKKK